MINRTPSLTKLKNGIRLLVFPMGSTQTVSTLIIVKVGSRNEEERLGGISHFLEHLVFKGTKRRPTPLAIAQEIEQVGGFFNAFTSKEYTGFYITAASEHLELLLDILSDILTGSIFDPHEIEQERGVILEEMRLYFDTPMERIGEIFEVLLYGNQPLGREIIGTYESVKHISRQDVVDYMASHYHGENIVVALSGKINENDITKAKSFFERFNNGHPAKLPLTQKTQKTPAVLLEKKHTDQAHIALGFPAFSLADSRKETLDLVAALLGSGKSSRMFQKVREELGLAYYIDTEASYYTDAGYLVTIAGVNVEKIDIAIKTILGEYQKMARDIVDDRELTQVKNYIKGRVLIELESSFRVARLVGSEELLLERRESLEEYFARLFAVTPYDIQQVAKTVLDPNQLNLAVIGPFESDERFRKILNDSAAS